MPELSKSFSAVHFMKKQPVLTLIPHKADGSKVGFGTAANKFRRLECILTLLISANATQYKVD